MLAPLLALDRSLLSEAVAKPPSKRLVWKVKRRVVAIWLTGTVEVVVLLEEVQSEATPAVV